MQDYESIVVATGDGCYRLELVPAFGRVSNSLIHTAADGTQTALIAGLYSRADLELDRYFRGVALYPFVNRLKDGCYVHNGKRFQFALNEPALGNSLHGFLYKQRPRVEQERSSQQEAEVTLVWRYAGDVPAYPFAAEVRLHCHLHSEHGLTLSFTVKNLHHQPVPLAIGWHPFFTLGQKLDELWLQLPPVNRIEVNERLLPTGASRRFDRFDQATAIGDLGLDDCMELLDTGQERASTLLCSPKTGQGIEIWQMTAEYPYLQVFTPPDRLSIAIEPVSGGINCFNTGRHLRLLGSDEVFAARCGVRMMPEGR